MGLGNLAPNCDASRVRKKTCAELQGVACITSGLQPGLNRHGLWPFPKDAAFSQGAHARTGVWEIPGWFPRTSLRTRDRPAQAHDGGTRRGPVFGQALDETMPRNPGGSRREMSFGLKEGRPFKGRGPTRAIFPWAPACFPVRTGERSPASRRPAPFPDRSNPRARRFGRSPGRSRARVPRLRLCLQHYACSLPDFQVESQTGTRVATPSPQAQGSCIRRMTRHTGSATLDGGSEVRTNARTPDYCQSRRFPATLRQKDESQHPQEALAPGPRATKVGRSCLFTGTRLPGQALHNPRETVPYGLAH